MYNILDTKVTNELSLVRHGLFSREYRLTDNVYTYGKLCYDSIWRRKATATTATGTWMFKREGLFSSTILITDQSNAFIAKSTRDWFSRKRLITLQTGFEAEFYRPSVWSQEHIWDSRDYGKIMHIKSFPFNVRFVVYIDQSMTHSPLIPLLIFFGAHLIILQRQRRTAHS